jgi:hypothetical protein
VLHTNLFKECVPTNVNLDNYDGLTNHKEHQMTYS